MAEIFGVDENIWCHGLTDALKQLEVSKKERDKHGEPRSATSGTPVKVLSVEHSFNRLEIIAYLDGEPVERVHMRIGIS